MPSQMPKAAGGAQYSPLKRKSLLTRRMMMMNIIPMKTTTALSNHCSQFSGLNPVSAKSRMKSACRESSSQILERIE